MTFQLTLNVVVIIYLYWWNRWFY